MNAAIPIAAGLFGLLALAGGSRSSASGARRSPLPSRTVAPSQRTRVCTYTSATLPLDSDALVLQWARCAGRTAGEIEGVAGRGAAAGRPAAWIDRVRRAWQQAQELSRRPPDGLSSTGRRRVESALSVSDAAARSRPMAEEPESLAAIEAEKVREDVRRASAEVDRAEAAARMRQQLEQEQASVSGGVPSAVVEVGAAPAPIAVVEIESSASGYDPQLARRLASQTARAVRQRLPGASLNVNHFRQAAGLAPGPYDRETEAALRHFGIRHPPEGSGPEKTYHPPRAER